MDKPAAISAQLVDVRNVGMHKCIKLTLHVPAELAGQVMAAFGWPTSVDPVPVALARLNLNGDAAVRSPERTGVPPRRETPPSSHSKRSFDEMSLTQQAGMLCSDAVFQTYLRETYPDRWRLLNEGTDAERATLIVRSLCNVATRKDIMPNTPAGTDWQHIVSDYRVWKLVPEFA